MLGHAGSEGPKGSIGAGMATGWARKASRAELPDCPAVLGGRQHGDPQLPRKGIKTRRGPGQKPEEHLLKLHAKEETANNQGK